MAWGPGTTSVRLHVCHGVGANGGAVLPCERINGKRQKPIGFGDSSRSSDVNQNVNYRACPEVVV